LFSLALDGQPTSRALRLPARRRRLAVAIASLRLALARRSGQFTEVVEQLNALDASIAAGSSEPVAMGSELRGVALMNLGIVETWSRRFDDAERRLSGGATLARRSAGRTSRSRVALTKFFRPRMPRSRARANGGVRR
jgi:hypothetical protein